MTHLNSHQTIDVGDAEHMHIMCIDCEREGVDSVELDPNKATVEDLLTHKDDIIFTMNHLTDLYKRLDELQTVVRIQLGLIKGLRKDIDGLKKS